MTTTLKEALKNLHDFDDNPVELDQLEDGSIKIHILPLEKTKTETKEVSGTGKWAKFAEKMHEESPLRGQSEKLKGLIREFKDDFSFDKE